MLRWILPLIVGALAVSGPHSIGAEPRPTPVFSFHLFSEDVQLDPQLARSSTSNYLFSNLYRGLFRYHAKRGLILDGAEKCDRESLKLICALRPDHRWSDGQIIYAQDYVRAFRRLISPKTASPHAEILFSVKNARAIQAGKITADRLGVRALAPNLLEIELNTEDFEFEYKLALPAASPLPKNGYVTPSNSNSLIVSGPYRIQNWETGHKIRLEPNPHYRGFKQRPQVDVFFIDDDLTALRLYEAGKLKYLRRLTALSVKRLKKSKEFHSFPMARFDYVGFNHRLQDDEKARLALTEGVDFSTFLKIVDTISYPGCPSLPSRYFDRVPCLNFNLKRAQRDWRQAKSATKKLKLELHYSLLGGDDIATAAEWLQGQWKKSLGIEVNLQGTEQKLYISRLRASPPDIFRKGVSLDRPTCLAGLEVFSRGHPENYLQLDDPIYEGWLKKLRTNRDPKNAKVLCRQAMEYLLSLNRIIPLGEMFFSVLARPEYMGWQLNELNQLDLTDLTYVGP